MTPRGARIGGSSQLWPKAGIPRTRRGTSILAGPVRQNRGPLRALGRAGGAALGMHQ